MTVAMVTWRYSKKFMLPFKFPGNFIYGNFFKLSFRFCASFLIIICMETKTNKNNNE
jgi:hypothetical protein